MIQLVIGSQWGDEGKGKIVDMMAEKADLVVRFHGGNNAGHTVVVNGKKIVGSAQTRKKGKVLQHGAVLIDINIEKYCSLFNTYSEKSVGETIKRVTSLKKELSREISFDEVASQTTNNAKGIFAF